MNTLLESNVKMFGATCSNTGASFTISLLIPVSAVMYLGILTLGLIRVWYFPSISFPLCSMIATSVMEPEEAWPPVVSISTMAYTLKIRNLYLLFSSCYKKKRTLSAFIRSGIMLLYTSLGLLPSQDRDCYDRCIKCNNDQSGLHVLFNVCCVEMPHSLNFNC